MIVLRESTIVEKRLRVKLMAAREKKDWNHRESAEALGISRPYYTLIENGQRNPNAVLLFKMASIFDIPVEDIMATEGGE